MKPSRVKAEVGVVADVAAVVEAVAATVVVEVAEVAVAATAVGVGTAVADTSAKSPRRHASKF